MKTSNVFPIFDKTLHQKNKEQLLKQHAYVFWFTGLSGSGKSTLAIEVEKHLYNKGYLTYLLDGDNVRSGLNSDLGFSEDDRQENIRRIAEVAKLFTEAGIIVFATFVSPTIKIRELAKQIITPEKYFEIYVNAPLEICENRDVKGLYKKARSGEILDFTGIHQPFEPPEDPFLEVETDQQTINESVDLILSKILSLVKY
jgi:adenylylsulfate kinase